MNRTAGLICFLMFHLTTENALAQQLTDPPPTPRSPSSENATAQPQKADDARTARAVIQQIFPDLDRNTLDGWVDAYAGIPAAELRQMLIQRKVMTQQFGSQGSLMPDFQLKLPGSDDLAGKPGLGTPELLMNTNPIEMAIQQLRTDLKNSLVLGYRAHEIAFTRAGEQLQLLPARKFAPGRIVQTNRPLDLAITNSEDFFCLQPGCILTRYGRFLRLPDGRLGQEVNGKMLSLYPEVRVPENIEMPIVRYGKIVPLQHDSAEIRNEGPPENQTSQIKLVSPFAAALTSEDGIYFQGNPALLEKQLTFVKAGSVRTMQLEQSNVDVAATLEVLEQLERMSRAF